MSLQVVSTYNRKQVVKFLQYTFKNKITKIKIKKKEKMNVKSFIPFSVQRVLLS